MHGQGHAGTLLGAQGAGRFARMPALAPHGDPPRLLPPPPEHTRARARQCVLEFPLACGITVGTPVRIRGVPVGSVLAVHPSLERVEVLAEARPACPPCLGLGLIGPLRTRAGPGVVDPASASGTARAAPRRAAAAHRLRRAGAWEAPPSVRAQALTCGARAAQIKDAATAIPRNSLIEANQSGLIAEPLVDITPQLPIPQYRVRLFCSTPWTAARCISLTLSQPQAYACAGCWWHMCTWCMSCSSCMPRAYEQTGAQCSRPFLRALHAYSAPGVAHRPCLAGVAPRRRACSAIQQRGADVRSQRTCGLWPPVTSGPGTRTRL